MGAIPTYASLQEMVERLPILEQENTALRAENERLRDVLGSIDGMYQFILDDSAVSEKPKPTWPEFGAWVHEQVGEALKEAINETPTAYIEKDLRARLKEYVDLAIDLRKKLYIETGDPKWQRYVDSLWEQVNRVTNPEEYEEGR